MSFRWMPRSRPAATPRNLFGIAPGGSRRRRHRALLEWLEERTVMSTSLPLNSSTWTPIGPAGITSDPNKYGGFMGTGGPTVGRIAGLAADPGDPNTLYAAAAGGGVWKTVNAGTTWTPLTDNQQSMYMGSIAVSPSDPGVIYAGTGEATNSGDSYAGRGVLVSADGGTTWTMTGQSVFDRRTVQSIAIDPADPKTAYAAVSAEGVHGLAGGTGVYKTTDEGATWTLTTASVSTSADYSAVVVDPVNPSNVYAAVGTPYGAAANGVYKSTDAGTTWKLAGNFPSGTGVGVTSLAIAASDPSVLVAAVADPATDSLKGVYRTTDAGATWNALSGVPNFISLQAAYNNVIAISPTDPNVIFGAGVVDYAKSTTVDVNGIVESRDGGKTWTDLTVDANGVEPHTDHHAFAFDASGRLLEGNDGGVWRLNDATPTGFRWQDLNSNLQITEFEGVSLDPTNPNIVYGGSQDNGTERFNDNGTWTMVYGGDGGPTAVDPSNPATVYYEYPTSGNTVYFFRSDDSGNTYPPAIKASGINGSDPVNFYAPYVIDPSNPSTLYYGTSNLYKTTNRGDSWTAVTSNGKNGWTSSAPIQTIAVSPSDPKTLYVATDDAKIFVSTDGGTNWTERDIASAKDKIEQIKVDPLDPKTAYAVRSEYNSGAGTGHVYKTTDGGANWTDISGNLPDIPAYSVAIDDRATSQRVYVGNDNGVWMSSDNGASWAPYKKGMPNVQVTTLELNTGLNVLLAGTHGRGAFEIVATESVTLTPVTLNPVEGAPLGDTLIASFTDSTGLQPLSTYSASVNWGDGTGTVAGTIVDLGDGTYGVRSDHTFAEEGTYKVVVSVTSTAGSSGSVQETVGVADAPLTGLAAAVTTTEGQKFLGQVATFTDANPNATASDFTATIAWGDGHTTAGTVTKLAAGGFGVSGVNTYLDAGPESINVTVRDVGGSTVSVSNPITVQDAPLSSTPVSFTPSVGRKFTGVTLATFVDQAPGDAAGGYAVTVDWGDGSAPDSTLISPSSVLTVTSQGAQFGVIGSHLYRAPGTYKVSVRIVDEGGATTSTTSTATVADAPITVTGVNFAASEGQSFSGRLATFTSANPLAQATDFLAPKIDWGDGSPFGLGTVTDLGGGKFGVTGTHTYAEEGTYATAVQVSSVGTSQAQASSTATVADAPLAASGATLTGTAGQTISGEVATFLDASAAAPLKDFTATIKWGDGSTSAGLVSQPGGTGTPFVVSGSHAYASAQSYAVSVTVKDKGGATDTAASTVTVADATIAVVASSFNQSILEGNPFNGVVGGFTTANTLATPANYIASIDWGDGTSSGGQLTLTRAGSFSVAGLTPHVYAEEGSYPVKLTVVSLGGERGSASSTLTVQDAPIVGTPGAPVTTTAGSAFSGVVGTFRESNLAPLGDFTASINWGDGHTSPGTVAQGPGGTFTVSGSNTYTAPGNYLPTVTVADVGGSTGVFTVGATATDPPIASTSNPISAVQGRAFSGTLATVTEPNTFAQAGEFVAVINWGDGSAPQAGTVTGSGGTFTVSGSHVFNTAGASIPVTVAVLHSGTSGAVSVGSAHVLVPLSAGLSPSSDTGVSNTDGVTAVNRPVFTGRAEPGSTVRIYTAPTSNPSASTAVGSATADTSGNFSVQIGPLGDGSYVTTASMTDPLTGATVETTPAAVGTSGGPLVIATSGPTVSSVSLNPATQTLRVVYQTGPAGMTPAGLLNPANYALGLAAGLGVTPIAVDGISAAPVGNGQVAVNVHYNLGRRVKAGNYVVTLHAGGLADLAGNTLVETRMVTFPQATNSPNPDYVAQINVGRNLVASAPQPYVSLAEQRAATSYANYAQGLKTVRVPRGIRGAGSVLNPTLFRRRK